MPGMIVAPQPVAVEEGAKVLMSGGNAVDAAVTCALVQSVLSPHMCGIGGYIIATLHLAGDSEGSGRVLDAPALAGSKVSPAMWEQAVLGPNPDGWGFFLKDKVNDLGYQSVCVPGAVKGFAAMLERWGTRSWQAVLEPAAGIAREGFLVDKNLADGWRARPAYPEASCLMDYVQGNAEASRIYLNRGGRPYEVGDRVPNPDYAATLEHLADHGPEDFYRGELAETIAADLAANGSFVTAGDLADYRLRDPDPVVGTYRGYRVVSAQPPHGGPTLAAILNILEGWNLASLGHNSPAYIERVAMAMKAAFADRSLHLADPDFVDVPLDWMTSKERASHWRRTIEEGGAITVEPMAPEPPDTTQVSVVDSEGNCVSLTHSLGMSSGVITPGLGFMYNNSMINFHPLAGHPNSIAPGKGRTTGMTPTLVYKGDRPVVVIGAPGATRIITSVLQVLLNILDFGMSASDAVLAPRFDCQGDLIRCQARIPEFVCAQVRRNHPIERLPLSHGGMGLVHAIVIDPETGQLSGGADTGSGGMALLT